jgi:tetratricopeptide (TPR) repeat protein
MFSWLDKKHIVSLVIIALFDLVLTRLPLTSVFGFEYSAFNSILLVIITGLLTISFLKRREVLIRNLLRIIPFILLIPAVISVANSLITTTCSLGDGFLFYLVITVPSILIGASLGSFSFYFMPRFPRLLFFSLLLLTAFIPFAEFYFNPQTYFYNPLIGLFPGTIYDEGLSVTVKLVIYRLINTGFYAALFYLSILGLRNPIRFNKYSFTFFFSFVVIVFIYLSPNLGFSTTKGRIVSTLKGKCYTEHFEIIYDTSIDSLYLQNVIVHHEYYYSELKKYFNSVPPKMITSFVFRDNKQKGELFGSANADVAKPWLYQVFTTANSFNISLKHEIAHIFSAEFGSGPFKITGHYNPALIEGIAEAASPFYGTWYIDQLASVAWNNNYKVDIVKLFSGFSFFSQNSSLSYVYAGSFSNFLIKRYGMDKYCRWYRGKSFDEVYSSSLKDVSEIYYVYLKDLGYNDRLNTAQYFFGRQTIFSKFCPRYIADRLEKGWSFYYKKNYSEAEKIFSQLNSITRNYSALYGLVNCKIKLKKNEEALTLLKKELPGFRNSSYYYGLELLLGDVLVRNRFFAEAKGRYFLLNSLDPDFHVDYLSKLRLNLAVSDLLIYNYITGEDSIKYLILKKYNSDEYDYASIPVMIDLAVSLDIPYKDVLNVFDKTITVNDIFSSYASYYLSEYMMEHLDYKKSRNFATLALRYNSGDGMNIFLRSHFLKSEWMYYNSDDILNKLKK